MVEKKHVDESWKEQASLEKDILAKPSADPAGEEKTIIDRPEAEESDQEPAHPEHGEQAIEVNFLNYLTSLGFQAMIFMGEIPNPVTHAIEKNLIQAKFIIDTLCMLKDKTAGNLNDQEKNFLEGTIYELQMQYIQISQKDVSAQEGGAQ